MGNRQLIEEARRRYPIGTKFYPAHISDARYEKIYCIVVNDRFTFEGGDIIALTDSGDHFMVSCEHDYDGHGNTALNRIVYHHGKWAEIVEETTEQVQIPDKVNPPHYKKGEVECIDAIASATVGKSGIEAVCVANVIKYLWRYEDKGGVTDVEKGLWYLNKLVEQLNKK
jgi:hypothetical protein